MAKLRVRFVGEKPDEFISLPEGDSLDSLLDAFINRSGRFQGDWVEIDARGDRRYVRYDQIIEVKAQMNP
jgi:hypothetical protein